GPPDQADCRALGAQRQGKTDELDVARRCNPAFDFIFVTAKRAVRAASVMAVDFRPAAREIAERSAPPPITSRNFREKTHSFDSLCKDLQTGDSALEWRNARCFWAFWLVQWAACGSESRGFESPHPPYSHSHSSNRRETLPAWGLASWPPSRPV